MSATSATPQPTKRKVSELDGFDQPRPYHRQPPAPAELRSHPHLARIKRVRAENRAASKATDDEPGGPLTNGLRSIKDFANPASGWNEEHLSRFQIVVMFNQPSEKMFSKQLDKKGYQTMVEDDFFEITRESATKGVWPKNKAHACFFMDLMQLLHRNGDETSPPQGEEEPVDEEESADEDVPANEGKQTDKKESQSGAEKNDDSASEGTAGVMQDDTTDAIYNAMIVNEPPYLPFGIEASRYDSERQTSSLMHSFLSYIAAATSLPNSQQWVPRYPCSSID
jgi:hypothetical protein